MSVKCVSSINMKYSSSESYMYIHVHVAVMRERYSFPSLSVLVRLR